MVTSAKGIQDGAKESSSILNATMTESSTEIAAGAKKSLNIVATEIKDLTKKDGDLDLAFRGGVDLYANNINHGVQKVIHNNMLKAGAIIVGLSATYFVAQYGIPLAFKMLERALMKPKLIIASSKKSLYQTLFGTSDKKMPMIFTPNLEARLNGVVEITSMINKKLKAGNSNVKYRNLMLYGPPGTGKTLFATELAKRCGMEYAFMSGSSFSKFKDGEGIEALDELFAWANKSSGLLIFIDEAETFLSKRENMDPQSKAYLLLNNFLNYTGTRSNKFMVVFATNHKDALDSAMYRRIDDLIEMPLPGLNERIRILNLYKDIILLDTAQNEKNFVSSVVQVLNENKIANIAQKTKGFSGSELEGIMNNIKTGADILDPSILTNSFVDSVVQQSIDKYIAFTSGKFIGTVED
jgi:ATPase family AAA domain-containing protein 3A/B